MLTIIVPAVVEPEADSTVRSLLSQTVAPDRIIVAINNTDDPTTRESVARVESDVVEVMDLGHVSGKKAGALNKVNGALVMIN